MTENNNDLEKLEECRSKINEIDEKLIEYLNKRANVVVEIGEIKKRMNLDVYQPDREIEIINRIKSKSELLKPGNLEAIWKEIMGSCKDIQGTVFKVGYLGPEGTFTHQASLDYFSKAGTEFLACKNIVDIFEKIEKDILDYGVIPIENSLQGTVRDTLDLLIDKDLGIYGEIELRIVQNLISTKDSNLSEIKKIYSHPQAFAQTRAWLKTNLPNAELINASSTSAAVKEVSRMKNPSNAAIGTKFSSEVHNLKILSAKIEDNPSNYTRFLIISKKENPIKAEKNKTSIVFVTKHVPGALYRVLKIFADAGINLTKIESRPRRKGKWEYIFLMDFEGIKNDPKVKEIFEKMSDYVIWHKILGSYPIFS